MKKAKKLVALILAAVMMLAMSATAFAAQSSTNTITVNGAKEGETYKAFKMLELFVNDTTTPTAYAYTVASDWANFFADTNISVWGTVLEKDTTGTYFTVKSGVNSETAWSSSSALSAFAEAAAKYAADNNLTPVASAACEAGKTAVVLNTTESGYYLVTSTLGTIAMIDTTPGDVTINEKNSTDSIAKTVKEDSSAVYGKTNDAQIGDTVEFKSVATIVPRSINVKIHDTMDSGLTLNAGSIKVYTDEALTIEYTGATVRTTAADSGDTFTIDIPDTFAATAGSDQKLYVVYTAELNSNAVVKGDNNVITIVAQDNDTWVTFGAGTSSLVDTTTTTTHKFTVHKFATNVTNLADAIFQVKKGETVVNLVKLDDVNYRVVDDTETTTAVSHVKANNEVETVAAGTIVSDFVTVESGDIVIWGVDSDSDYTIVEIQAPKGYNMLNPASVSVTVDAANTTTIDVENMTGTELPSTGGIGTTIFYVIGGILVLGAGVVLVAKKRMRREA